MAGRNHRVNRIFLLDHKVEQKRAWCRTRLVDGNGNVGACGYCAACDAVSIGQFDEVRTDQRRGFVVAVIEELLPLANHAEISVVDDGDVDLDLFLHDGGKLGGSHLKSAIAGNHPYLFVGASDLRPDRCGQSKAHGSKAAGSDQRTWPFVVEVLRLPHLVLSYIG